jgi:hypothetical protein
LGHLIECRRRLLFLSLTPKLNKVKLLEKQGNATWHSQPFPRGFSSLPVLPFFSSSLITWNAKRTQAFQKGQLAQALQQGKEVPLGNKTEYCHLLEKKSTQWKKQGRELEDIKKIQIKLNC